MQIGQAQVVRSDWLDRNPLIVTRQYDAEPTQSSKVLRWTYTVPVNRKAFISSLLLSVRMLQGGVSTAMYTQALIMIQPSGGADVDVHSVGMEVSAVGDNAIVTVSDAGLLSAGDQITFYSVNTVDGPDFIRYIGTLILTEFDA